MTIHQMRKTYSLAGLSEKDVDPDPLVQFQRWFEEARQPDLPDWFEVNAMNLSTCDAAGRVTSRIVLLKGLENGKLAFFTNYDSTKGRQIEANPHVALCFLWPHLERQVRVEGTVVKSSRRQSEEYFQSRPREHQLGAHVSQQSSVIDSRETLEKRLQEVESEFSGTVVECPENWGGYELHPLHFEFWQGRPARLHDRICYRHSDDQWTIYRVAP